VLGRHEREGLKDVAVDLRIREVRPEDAAGVVAIFNPIIEAGVYTAFDAPFTVEAERSYIEALPERAIFLVAERLTDGVLVGFQSMEPFATYTQAFAHVGVIGTYVDLECRRQGVAGRLFQATFPAARAKAYEKLLTYIRADNPPALTAYLRQGFRVVGTAQRQAKLRGLYVDEVIVERFL
jgi:L-amino acid N-acyltransferase YncA